jgi:hypothetical protein
MSHVVPPPKKKQETLVWCRENVTNGRTDRQTDTTIIPAWTQQDRSGFG